MEMLRKLSSLTLVLVAIAYAGYFAFLNSSTVYVILPILGEVSTSGAVSYIVAFVAGAIFASCYFALDWMRKSMKIRGQRRALDKFERERRAVRQRESAQDGMEYSSDEQIS